MIDRTLLYHYPLCPFCRQVRLILFEKGVPYTLIMIPADGNNSEFIKINPTRVLPTIVEVDSYVLSESTTILEYLNELKPYPDFLGETPRGRAEVRRLMNWFDKYFYDEVYKPLYHEKVKKLEIHREADLSILRAGRLNLKRHLEYVDWLASRKNYLAGRYITLADFSAAAHLSILDYLGEIDWNSYSDAASWYAKIKSRPSFENLLKDRIAGILPSETYKNLDF